LIQLEMIQQIESNKPANLGRCVKEVLNEGLARALPVLFVWALLWFLLAVVQSFTRRKNAEDSNGKFSTENAAKALAGYRPQFSFSDGLFHALKKSGRIVVFLILPAIAWEELWPMDAMRRGLHILKAHLSTFASGFALTEMASYTVFLPASILMYFSVNSEVVLPDELWIGIIIYSAFAWSFSIFIEQMFAAQLYLWHLKWIQATQDAATSSLKLPKFEDVPPPSILDDVPEFISLGNSLPTAVDT